MLNFLDALRPEQGLVESSELAPEAPPTDLLWRMLIRLNVDESRVRQTVPEGDGKLSPFVVGAYGYSRADSLVRGVGEAVERFSLINAAAPRQTAQDASSGNGAATHPHEWSWLVDPAFREDDSAHVVGLRLHSGDTCEVPLGLIDYPYVGPQADCFDESPSGAASGENADAAIRRALLEVIERDAFMVTWDCGSMTSAWSRSLRPTPKIDGARRACDRPWRSSWETAVISVSSFGGGLSQSGSRTSFASSQG